MFRASAQESVCKNIGVRVRQERPEEGDDVDRLVSLAFDGRWNEPALVAGLRSEPTFRPEFAVVAERDDGLVGHAMLSPVALEGNGHRRFVLALAPVSVLPAVQGQGIGTALVECELRLADEAGEPLVVVLGDREYYGRFGFEAAEALGVSPPKDVPVEAFSVRRLHTYTPTWRGTIHCPSVFAGTETI